MANVEAVLHVAAIIPESRRARRGFSIVEVLVAVLIMGVLSAIALPSYRHVSYGARAASIINDLHTVRNAAFQYELEEGSWPGDVSRGVAPPELSPYMSGVEFRGNGYVLDWDNWDDLIGIAVIVEDPLLASAILATLRTSEGTFIRLGDRYTYVIDS